MLMMRGWRPRGPETRHSLGNGCETRVCSERPPGEVPRAPVEKRRSDEAGSAAVPVAPVARTKLASYTEAKPRTPRTQPVEKRGSDEASRRHWRSRFLLKQSWQGYTRLSLARGQSGARFNGCHRAADPESQK